MKPSALLLLALLALPVVARAQGAATVRAGMTEAEVRRAFGAPATVRRADGWSYLFYLNRCPVRCGSDDVVFLQDGRVVAAVLRTPARRFAGPGAARALGAVEPAGAGGAGARVEGIRIEVPGTRAVGVGAREDTIRPRVVGPFPGRARRDSVPATVPVPRDPRVRVPLAPPDTIDFSRPPGRRVPLPAPDTIDFSGDTARVAPRPPARPR